MGHIRLGKLPRAKRWAEVVDLLGLGAGSAAVAAATLDAAEADLRSAPQDPAVLHAFWLLTQLPDAARSDDFASALRDLGVHVESAPSVAELGAALTQAIDRHALEQRNKSDLGEMAQLAAVQSLTGLLQSRVPTLFGTTPDDVRSEVAKLATEKQFGSLAKEFFADFSQRFLTYYTSRELPSHVGRDRAFPELTAHDAFNQALDVHCQQASRIVETFAGTWYSKSRFEKTLTPERTAGFIGYALTKMRRELKRGD